MPKIPLSDMCAQDFVELTAALGLKYKDLAKALNLSGATVSLYSTGKAPIPEHVKTQLHSMCNERRRKLESLCHRTMPTIHSLIVATNELRAQEQAQVIPRLVHRDATPLTRTYPVYRMHPQKQGLYVGALAAYYETISNTLKSSNDQDSRRGLELGCYYKARLITTASRGASGTWSLVRCAGLRSSARPMARGRCINTGAGTRAAGILAANNYHFRAV
jgi:DNA-binding Xre family transcriptional regulator